MSNSLERDPKLHILVKHEPDESFLEYAKIEVAEGFKTDWWLMRNPDVLAEWVKDDFDSVKDGITQIGRALLALPFVLQRHKDATSNGNKDIAGNGNGKH